MNWLTDNPIANMYGPDFLLFYGTVCALALAACWLFMRRPQVSITPEFEPSSSNRGALRIRLLGSLVIAGLGGYKLVVALAKGRHNVGFLILIGVISLLVLSQLPPGGRPEGNRR